MSVERLSDNSRITFNISSDKTIEHLRGLLNHHLPPYINDQFNLYSYQRGALIHFHPMSFKLDYFPVIFDQSVLLLKMDDRMVKSTQVHTETHRKKSNSSAMARLFTFRHRPDAKPTRPSSTSPTCVSTLKRIFNRLSCSLRSHTYNPTSALTSRSYST